MRLVRGTVALSALVRAIRARSRQYCELLTGFLGILRPLPVVGTTLAQMSVARAAEPQAIAQPLRRPHSAAGVLLISASGNLYPCSICSPRTNRRSPLCSARERPASFHNAGTGGR
jgi:hypothetical protein